MAAASSQADLPSRQSSVPARSWTRRLPWLPWLLLLAAGLAVAALAGRWAENAAIERLREAGAQRLHGYALGLENLLSKYDFLPGTLELNKDVLALLERQGDTALRREVNATWNA